MPLLMLTGSGHSATEYDSCGQVTGNNTFRYSLLHLCAGADLSINELSFAVKLIDLSHTHTLMNVHKCADGCLLLANRLPHATGKCHVAISRSLW